MQISGKSGCSSQVDEDTLPRVGEKPHMEENNIRSKDPDVDDDDDGTHVDSPILCPTAMA